MSKYSEDVVYQDYMRYKISCILDKEFNLLFLFINTRLDEFIILKKELIKCKDEFLRLFKDNLHEPLDLNIFKAFDKFIDSIQNKFPPHISLVGYKGVGKTSIFNLIRTKEFPIENDPQISGNVARLKIGRINFVLRDFTGSESIGFLWNNFIKGSDAVFIITNSLFNNVKESKFFIQKAEEETPFAYVIALGNKQDLEDAMDAEQIERNIGLKSYSLNGTNPEYRDTLIQIIIETLEMQDETAELLSLIDEREELITQLEETIVMVNIEKADSLIEKIVNLSHKIGDNPFDMAFHKKYKELKNRLIESQQLQASITPGLKKKQESQQMGSLAGRLQTLLQNYMKNVEGIISVIVSDREGFIITSESKKEAEDESILGAIAVTVDTFIERIKREFGSESSFINITNIHDNKFAYCSTGSKSILLTISDLSTTDTELRVYSEHIASKVEMLLEGNENVSLEIPEIIKVLSKTKEGKIPTGDYSLKLILTGDYKVGKTSLIMRFVQNLFRDSYHSTVGVDISKKVVSLSENTKMNFIIWDIGAQIPQMASYRKRFYGGANAAFIVVDRTRPDCLQSIKKWYDEIVRFVEKDINIILVGNKTDLVDKIVISEEEIKYYAEENNFFYILTSAKTGENVNDAFLYIAYRFLESAE